MLKKFVIALAVVVTASMVLALEAAGSDKTLGSHQLTCKSGKMPFTFEHRGDGELLVGLRFKRSKAPAASGLKPGECAWSDRGVLAGEPDILVGSVGVGKIEADASGRVVSTHFDDQPYIDTLLTSSGRLFVFEAHNGGQALRIDHYGP